MRSNFIFIFLFVSIFCIFSQTSKIFVVNLYPVEIDLRVGEESGFVFKASKIPSYAPSTYVETKAIGTYKIYVKETNSKDWIAVNSNGQVLTYEVKRGFIHCVVVEQNGYVNYFDAKDSSKSGAKILFFNGTEEEVSRMEIAKNWMDGNVAYTVNLSGNTVTNVVPITPGSYSMFWQFPFQEEDEKYYYYPDEKGNIFKYRFADGKYYLFIIYTIDGKDYANLFFLN